MEWQDYFSDNESTVGHIQNVYNDRETMNMNCVIDAEHVHKKIIGSNRRVRIVPIENLSVIHLIYNMVRSNFIMCWNSCEQIPTQRNKISSCITATAVRCIREYYKTSFGLLYFDEIQVLSCNDRLFTRHREWMMPVTDIVDETKRMLYLMVDSTEIERFMTYYLHVYLKSGVSVRVEFDDICDAVKNLKRKKYQAYLNRDGNCISKLIEKDTASTVDEFKTEPSIQTIVFYFCLLCVDKTISILNNMIIRSGGMPRSFHTSVGPSTDKKSLRTSILDILDSVTISASIESTCGVPMRMLSDDKQVDKREITVYKFK